MYPSTLIRKLCWENPYTLPHLLESYANKSRTLSFLLTLKLCRKIHVRFHAQLKVMSGNPRTLSRNPSRELCRQSMNALTQILSGSYAEPYLYASTHKLLLRTMPEDLYV